MSDGRPDDNLIHLDGLRELAQRAVAAQSVAVGELAYERFGVCTPDLVGIGRLYVSEMLQQAIEGTDIGSAGIGLFLAGFDLGYQARLEVESRELVNSDREDIE